MYTSMENWIKAYQKIKDFDYLQYLNESNEQNFVVKEPIISDTSLDNDLLGDLQDNQAFLDQYLLK